MKKLVTNPTGRKSGSSRVIRSGDWWFSGSVCQTKIRSRGTPTYRINSLGLRPVLMPKGNSR